MTDRPESTRDALRRRLAELSPAKRALLERGIAPAARPVQTEESIPRRDPNTPAPMSFAQELVWLLEQVHPGTAYNVPRVVRLQGSLDVPALQRAVDRLVMRHESLRTTLDVVDGQPSQIVHAPRPTPIERVDVSTGDASTAVERAGARVQEFARRPFDLANDRPLRVGLITIATDDHVLVLGSHHTASDGWSRTIVLRELGDLYREERGGARAPLPPLPIQYADFAAWQRVRMSGDVGKRLLDYWMERLDRAPLLLELPTDRPRPSEPRFEGAAISREYPRSLLDALRRVSSEHGVTLYMTLLAAFNVLLARIADQEDILVGSPNAARSQPETHGIVGYFTNTLLMRTRVDRDLSFDALLERVRNQCLGAYEHQELPFECIMLELQRTRRGEGPRLQVSFSLQDPEQQPFALDGTRALPFGSDGITSKFELSLYLLERPTGLRVLAEYRTDLFDAGTIERWLQQYATLLAGIVAAPTQCVSALPLLTADETGQRLALASGPTVQLPATTLAAMIAAQCAATPDAVAIECLDGDRIVEITFGALHAWSSSIARELRARGVGPGVGVGVMAERSPELIAALVGVLAAGGFYVPLDPDYPEDRIAFMVTDADLRLVLASRQAAVSRARAADPRDTLLLIDDIAVDEGSAASAWPADASPGDLAYAIYTSGSTGRPKGVMIPNSAVVNYLVWMRDRYDVDSTDAVLQKAPASFDASIWELFVPLVSGARLVLAPAAAPQDPAVLLETLERHSVTLVQFVPSQLRMVLEAGASREQLRSVRRVFFGGEALPRELLGRLLAACPDLPVTNLYGPTEATVYATFWDVVPGSWTPDQPVLLGAPIANTRVYVVDPAGALVPDGAAGEILIAGAGVAAGYLRRPELNAERFIPDPFHTDPAGARAYRTGDRARVRADGTLEYLGRGDGQIKLRGFRVELGEIESSLAACPGVTAAIVCLEQQSGDDWRIVAYVTTTRAVDPSTLRAHVRAQLPEYMVPSQIAIVDAIPLTPNGKVDRAALRTLAGTERQEDVCVPLSGPIEAVVASVWCEVLGITTVGAETNFFEVGGHSLLAMRVAARLARLLRQRVTLSSVFQQPTVRTFAHSLLQSEERPGRVEAICRALLALRDMTPEERARRRAAASDRADGRLPTSETV